jgi:hypothetical protein
MKKIFFTTAIVGCCLLRADINNAQDIAVPETVQFSMERKFRDAELVRWGLGRDAFVATLITYDGRIDAYFSPEGEFRGIGKMITEEYLPLAVKNKLKKDYGAYRVYQVYQYDCNDSGPCYYISMKNFQKDLIVRIRPSGASAVMKRCKVKRDRNAVG